jgi:hypothetical protein
VSIRKRVSIEELVCSDPDINNSLSPARGVLTNLTSLRVHQMIPHFAHVLHQRIVSPRREGRMRVLPQLICRTHLMPSKFSLRWLTGLRMAILLEVSRYRGNRKDSGQLLDGKTHRRQRWMTTCIISPFKMDWSVQRWCHIYSLRRSSWWSWFTGLGHH